MNTGFRFWASWACALLVLVAAIAFGYSQWHLARFSDLVSNRLVLLAELRRGAMQEYFDTARAELRFWSTSEALLSGQAQLNAIWLGDTGIAAQVSRAYIDENPEPAGYYLNLDQAEDGSAYSELHGRLHPQARMFVTHRGYYDLFLISPDGDVMYTVEKESDFATNLETGEFRDSGLGRVFAEAKRKRNSRSIAMSDMQPYAPSADAPAMFLATAIHDEEGEFIGVMALQLPTSKILGIMAYTGGMGETGESYLVGADKLMRSDSRFSEESTVLKQAVDTPTVRSALAGEQGFSLVDDYRGVEVLSAYLPLSVADTVWAVMVEIDKDEVVNVAARERPSLAAALALIYGLSFWSVWYWRGRKLPDDSLPPMDGGGYDLGDDGPMAG